MCRRVERARVTLQARRLMASAHRNLFGRLLVLRDWPTYVYAPLLLLLLVGLPVLACRAYRDASRSEMIVRRNHLQQSRFSTCDGTGPAERRSRRVGVARRRGGSGTCAGRVRRLSAAHRYPRHRHAGVATRRDRPDLTRSFPIGGCRCVGLRRPQRMMLPPRPVSTNSGFSSLHSIPMLPFAVIQTVSTPSPGWRLTSGLRGPEGIPLRDRVRSVVGSRRGGL